MSRLAVALLALVAAHGHAAVFRGVPGKNESAATVAFKPAAGVPGAEIVNVQHPIAKAAASVTAGKQEATTVTSKPSAGIPGVEIVNAHNPIVEAAAAVTAGKQDATATFKPAAGVPGAEIINVQHPIAKAAAAAVDVDGEEGAVAEQDIDFIAGIFDVGPTIENWKPYPLGGPKEEAPKPTPKPMPKLENVPSTKEAPKCDQVCTNGDSRARDVCMLKCDGLRKSICPRGASCHEKCNNQMKSIEKDPKCEKLCLAVKAHICAPFPYEAPDSMVSPHHDHQPPPSAESTPKPRVITGTFQVCNLYPSDYTFELFAVEKEGQVDGRNLTALNYEECGRVELTTLQMLGVRVQGRVDQFGQRRKGALAGISMPIYKIPSMMVFGVAGFNDESVMFEQYFVQGAGAMVCNGFPLWKKEDEAEPIQLIRGDFDAGKKIAKLGYRECTATGLAHGDIASIEVRGKRAGQYHVRDNPAAIVLGKAGQTTAIAFEASGDIKDILEA